MCTIKSPLVLPQHLGQDGEEGGMVKWVETLRPLSDEPGNQLQPDKESKCDKNMQATCCHGD